jgi:hypothetical protein
MLILFKYFIQVFYKIPLHGKTTHKKKTNITSTYYAVKPHHQTKLINTTFIPQTGLGPLHTKLTKSYMDAQNFLGFFKLSYSLHSCVVDR